MVLSHFHRRGYPLELLKSAWDIAKHLDREALIRPKPIVIPPPTDNVNIDFFLTTTYNPASPNLKRCLTNNWDLLDIPPYDYNIDPSRVKLGHRRCPNLRVKLCRATIDYPPTNEDQIGPRRTHRDQTKAQNKCTTSNCRYCSFIEVHGRIISHITGRTYHAPVWVTCKSNNLVCVITCRRCLAQYVGETYRPFHKRIYEHLYSIGHNADT